MKKIYGLVLTAATLTSFSVFETSATEQFEIKDKDMPAYLKSRRFDLSLSENYIREEKEKAFKLGFEEGVKKGTEQGIERWRIEEDKVVALKKLTDGIKSEQIQELEKSPTK